MDFNKRVQFARSTLPHVIRFAALCGVVFAGLLLIAAVECSALWLRGIQYTPKSAVWRTSLCDFSVSADGRWGVTCERLWRKAPDRSPECDLVLQDLHQQIATPLRLSHLGPICVAMAPAGDSITLACSDGSIYLYIVASGDEPTRSRESGRLRLLHSTRESTFRDIVYSPNGEYVAAAGCCANYLLNLPEKKMTQTWPIEGIDGPPMLSFSQDSRRLLTYTGGDTARLWNTDTGKQVAAVPLQGAGVAGVVLSPKARVARFLGRDHDVQAWSFEDSELVPCESWTASLFIGLPPAFSPDGLVVATTGDSYTITLYNASTGEEVSQFSGHERQIAGLVFGSDRSLYTWDIGGSVFCWNVDGQDGHIRVSRKSAAGAITFQPLLSMGT